MILAWWCCSVTPLKSIFLSNYKVFGFKSFELLFFISKKKKKNLNQKLYSNALSKHTISVILQSVACLSCHLSCCYSSWKGKLAGYWVYSSSDQNRKLVKENDIFAITREFLDYSIFHGKNLYLQMSIFHSSFPRNLNEENYTYKFN